MMTLPSPDLVRTVAHEVRRLEVAVGAGFGDFRERYERAVPAFDAGRLYEFVRDGASWSEVLRVTEESAPHVFMRYWEFDATAVMRLAGDRWKCVEYLMGNHTIAQRMYTHEPAIMMYAPLRTVVYEDAEGTTRFAVDQPSTKFASFGDPRVAEVGRELDHRLADLLGYLGAPVPPVLRGQRE
ncbi:DUF302 domain-containing protein [Actinomadura sp. DC4]|uniref:DUF302 domain-containing protein n=1 Tax=Actinomadura sp. DC4 TaxID=3055069 RepID=UPI0025B0B637|nr:DUF302 domain-containing protein [Actinomadura sp. DC4]MDN3358780.1 DUF302 domain-containing protein [Actinomadura sp. DC4]